MIPANHPQLSKDSVTSLVRSLLDHQTMYFTIWSNWDEYP